MDEDQIRKPPAHTVGMGLDTMSVDELKSRISLLETEIVRLRLAIEAREKTRSAAEQLFRI